MTRVGLFLSIWLGLFAQDEAVGEVEKDMIIAADQPSV